jgi:phosphomannomutase
MSPLDAIFKAYDIRGTVPDQLDADVVRRIGAAFARFALDADGPCDRIVVARDMRPAGVELQAAFIEGVNQQGVDAVDLGLASTDLLFFASGALDSPGAVLTASHNPAQYNGIKLCLSGARAVGEDSGLGEVKRLTEAPPPPAASSGSRSERDMLPDYVRHVHSFVEVAALKPLRVVADTANGMGGLVVPAVFEGLPPGLEVMYGELDGTFPNHPADPIQPENQRDLRARVLATGADIGLAFDGDADRVFLVDETAEPVSGSTTTAIVAGAILEKEPGATILYNLICSKAVPETVREAGGNPIRTRVGHSLIKKVMAETGAAFGGEHSGHYYFRDNYRADSGIITALIVLERMSVTGKPLSELRRPFERYAASGEHNFRVDDVDAVMERVAAAFPDADQDRLDGLTIDSGSWWFNLRPSNTEPLLRLNLEGPTQEEVDSRVREVQAIIAAS